MTDSGERRLEYLPLEKLKFDPDNPRFPATQRGGDRTAALTWLLESANLLDLMRSIATQDFFPGEPLLATDDGDGTYTVIEGNRRYAACLLLNEPEMAPTRKKSVASIAQTADFKPATLPVLVLPEDEILGFLGYRHITGIQEWSPLAKARYLARLWNDDSSGPEETDERVRWISRKIGSKSDYVARLLTAFELFKMIEQGDFFDILGLDENSLSFSLIALSLNRPAVADFLGLSSGRDFYLDGLNEPHLRELTSWLFSKNDSGQTVLGESRNMTTLTRVISNERALTILRSTGDLYRASAVLSTEPDEISGIASRLNELVNELSDAVDDGAVWREEDIALLADIVDRLQTMAISTGTVS